ncbi:MAG: hypothetical protein JJ975_11280, partial [Bacteroidia bacterium]|nr:hypothetical protein [Bacteroidia bacterium]
MLSPKTLFVGQSSIFVERLDSTNDHLRSIVQGSTMSEGLV